MEMIAMDCENPTICVRTLCGKNAEVRMLKKKTNTSEIAYVALALKLVSRFD
jgi:hypothetical protein